MSAAQERRRQEALQRGGLTWEFWLLDEIHRQCEEWLRTGTVSPSQP